MTRQNGVARAAAMLAVGLALVLPLTVASPAQAYWWRGGGGWGWHGGWGLGFRGGWGPGYRVWAPGCCWRGGVYVAPPVVYAGPPVYYAPPPVYYAAARLLRAAGDPWRFAIRPRGRRQWLWPASVGITPAPVPAPRHYRPP